MDRIDRRSSSLASSSNLNPISSLSHPQSQSHSRQRQRQECTHQQDYSHSRLLQQQRQRTPGSKTASPALTRAGRFTEEWDASQRGSSIIDESYPSNILAMQRSNSVHSFAAGDDQQLPSRNNTLRKKSSMRRTSSLRRSSSRRSNRAGSVRSLALHSASDPDDTRSAFYCPVPTSGTPTDVLANRFQTWRKILKDLITYFREIQSHYEQRSKALVKLANVANNISTPPQFLRSAGIDDALQFLRNYNRSAIQEANKSREIEEDVILALTGLRSDLQQKIKEIKHLSGDFKNSVDREMEGTSKAVRALADVLDKTEVDSSSTTGKQDPYLMRLAVDRQVERQIDEENYLHQAYLNLESSGRELESIVVGEIQKAYNAYAGILKREADNAYAVVDELREGPIGMPKDQEWIHFVTHEEQFVDPTAPMRSSDQIHYPGQDHVSAQEIRAGLLERKSKYLKSYTAGWYVLSTTHLHEFKSADKAQAPVMSLYLPEQKLGSHSSEGGSSNKFILKGRQTGTMHRGHTWVFRAESHDTMMAWYEDIKALTEKTPEERSQFVRTHSRSLSQSSHRSVSSDGIVDEDDDEPFSANQIDVNPEPREDMVSRRPQPGGRFPSDLQINAQRGLQAPLSPSSVSSGHPEHSPDALAYAAAVSLPAAASVAGRGGEPLYQGPENHMGYGGTEQTPMENMPSQAAMASQQARHDGINPYTSESVSRSSNHGDTYFAGAVVGSQEYQKYETEGEVAGVVCDAAEPPNAPLRQNLEDGSHYDGNQEAVEHTPAGAIDNDSERYPNGHATADKINPVALAASNIPRSETQRELALQVGPESNAAEQNTPAGSALGRIGRPNVETDDRTDSVATISNLQIPGKFPKSSGVASP
ncbi:PH domain protein [Metarhizium rileyi]|uniref:PH domain protein n=1 Tax=Metarhizium rileyi (strain RCEF 4871) TaxID=1649241 RepID=A0A167IX23_METRR|nr:PH domain protein [Metarhizium rileyi RCEF 4871]TWU78113.1 hypothetical protein ED733_007249 [Metarhizium rileyi]